MGKAYELLGEGWSKAVESAELARMALAQLLPAQRRFAVMDAAERPFAHPYYWAAFPCLGVQRMGLISDYSPSPCASSCFKSISICCLRIGMSFSTVRHISCRSTPKYS
jgi:hypothetical protein